MARRPEAAILIARAASGVFQRLYSLCKALACPGALRILKERTAIGAVDRRFAWVGEAEPMLVLALQRLIEAAAPAVLFDAPDQANCQVGGVQRE